MISFKNTEIAFQSLSDKKLQKKHLLFNIMRHSKLTRIGGYLIKIALHLRLPISPLLKHTIVDVFCGGETIDGCSAKINELASYNIKTVLDYSVEGKATEKDFKETTNQILQTITKAEKSTNIPFSVFKISSIGRIELLEKTNRKIDLSHEEQQEYNRVIHRVNKICKKAHQSKIPVMIDAEESWIQDVIDNITEGMMKAYNKEQAVVFNTLQMYRKDRLDYLKKIHQDSKLNGYFLGFKFVRGAYLEKENKRAKKMGYNTPIQTDKYDCDNDYDRALEYACENIHGISICAGTHNEESSRYLMQLMKTYKIEKNNTKVYFAQLMGMSNHISYNLANEGYNVLKYMPYGPIKDMLPYLVRRAEENKSIAGQTGRELNFVKKELNRRNSIV